MGHHDCILIKYDCSNHRHRQIKQVYSLFPPVYLPLLDLILSLLWRLPDYSPNINIRITSQMPVRSFFGAKFTLA